MLTLLLVIALTFYRASRDDVRTADNAVNAVRAELLADGATAVAIAFINADHRAHPSFTSLDYAWRTYFNGAWFAGKPWLWAPLHDPFTNSIHPMSPLRGGVPELNLNLLDDDFFQFSDVYVPRVVLDVNQDPLTYTTAIGNTVENPFVYTMDIAVPGDPRRFSAMERLVNAVFGTMTFQADRDALEARVYDDLGSPRWVSLLEAPIAPGAVNETVPAEQIHVWADVDNDGDGLRDAMWLPMPADRYFPEDGLDNDLDGFIDEFDLDGEPGVFLYRGDLDGIDNDDDGQVDEIVSGIADEARFVIFTLPRPFTLPDGTVLTPADLQTYFTAMGIDTSNDTVLFEGIDTIGYDRDGNPFSSRDNDNDFVLDDHVDASQYMLTELAVRALVQGDPALNPYYDLLLAVVGQQRIDEYIQEFNLANFPNNARGRLVPLGAIQGENVTELAGRFAVTIKDESSKLNLNAAGGLTYYSTVFPGLEPFPIGRAFNRGVGPHELELRVLTRPGASGIGASLYPRIWTYRMGGRQGNALSPSDYSDPSLPPDLFSPLDPTNPFAANWGNYHYDVSLPGYGRVDDNGNLLELALNGIDDDGDGLADEGALVVAPLDFEGLDEPTEFQRFRPYRNRIAELEGDPNLPTWFPPTPPDANLDGRLDAPAIEMDNDSDDVQDEIGEFADRFYRTHHELKLVDSFGSTIFEGLRNFITTHSFDRNERHLHIDTTQATYRSTPGRLTTGLRKDLNVARPDQVARAVMRDWTYTPSVLELRQEFGAAMGAPADDAQPGVGPIAEAFLAGLRQENTSIFTDQAILSAPAPAQGPVGGFTQNLVTTLLADPQLRAHQVAASIKDYADLDSTRSVDEVFVDDAWWRSQAGGIEDDPATPENEALVAGISRIKYNLAGIERIRINEVNVRPVRRVEAEATTDTGDVNYALGFDPNRFVPRDGSLTPEQIEDQGFRVRRRTTVDAINDYTGAPLIIDSVDFDNSWALLDQLGLLGMGAAWTTYRSYLTVTDVSDPDNPRNFEVPDVIQFSFQATDELPGSRYYMAMNSQFIDDILAPDQYEIIDSVERPSDMSFAVKIGALNDDWFTDLVNIDAYVRSNRTYGQAWRSPALIGSDDMGGSGGMAFLQGGASFRANNIGSGTQSITPELFLQNNTLEPNLGFTIEVPPRIGAATSDQDLWIHVAIQSRQEEGEVMAVNYFDFSQEPDHEYVEIVNLDTENAVDLSGWQLAVENHPLGLGPMTIPPGTTIAPGGMLLLGTNKYDFGFDLDLFDPGIGFFDNGIGLANAADVVSLGGRFDAISVPRVYFDTSDVNQGSVFLATGGIDYVDRDGNGAFDTNTVFEDNVVSTIDPPSVAGLLGTNGDKAFDRIVELIVPDLIPQQPAVNFTAFDVGRIVLGGGIFPNRPEFDLWDNDGDEVELRRDEIDNDLDGEIDEDDEGVDEGRFAREERLLREFVSGSVRFSVPGGFNTSTVRYLTRFFDFDPNGLSQPPSYWDAGSNPPQWKEFLERRNFPGDNVIVTLYEGQAEADQVADRVTYNQRDVDNRAIDDILLVTDADTDGIGEQALAGSPIPLSNQYASLWPENTMGVDFARSLERRLPTYTGDRFGLSNRFEATDGNYDDWADSTGRWQRDVTTDPLGVWNALDPVNPILDRFAAAANVYGSIAHAVGGTPLRANVPARIALDLDLGDAEASNVYTLGEFPNRPMVSPGDAMLMHYTSRRERMDTFEAGGTNYLIDLDSPNVLSNAAPLTAGRFADADTTYDAMLLAQRLDGNRSPVNFFADARSFVGDIGTTDSVSLNVGQANVIQVTRISGSVSPVYDDPDAPWPMSGGVLTGLPPQRWSPLLAFELLNASVELDADFDFDTGDPHPQGTVWPYGYQRQYLFATPSASVVPATVDNARYPTHGRAVLYASQNFANFESGDALDGATALFVWDGDDGVENGEYDLYVVTTEDLDALRRADDILIANSEPRLLTDTSGVPAGVGRPFVEAAARTEDREVYLDIEVFRDVDADRRAWWSNILPGDALVNVELNRGQPGRPYESFGQITSAQPDADGMIHYGVVRVENNFLAVLVRNRSDAGKIARISRVILAARNKNPGRLNINTVETTRISLADPNDPADSDEQPHHFYNPLHAVPGVLALRTIDELDLAQQPPVIDAAVDNLDGDPLGPTTILADILPSSKLVTLLPISDNAPLSDSRRPDQHAHVLANQILNQRLRIAEQPDGRYYEITSDLLADAHFAPIDFSGNGVTDIYRPALVLDTNGFVVDPNEDGITDDAENELRRARAIEEAVFRFRKMQNLLTTQASVYEILVTAQTGYGVDENGDGRINWRDDTEFRVTGEKTARTIYER